MAVCSSSAPLDSKGQVQLLSSKQKSPAVSHTLIPAWNAFGAQQISAEAHLGTAPHSRPPPVHGGGSAGTECRKQPQSSRTSRLPALLHWDTHFNLVCSETLLSPRKPSSLKHRNPNYLLRSCLASLKLCILFSFVRSSTAWLYTELHCDPWFTLPPILFISLNCLEIARLLHGN